MGEKLTIAQALELAVKKHNQGKKDEAEIIYKKILSKNSENPDALHLLGILEFQKGDNQKALENIKKAIKIKPEARYYGNLAMIYDALGDEEKSSEFYKKALKINPRYGNAPLAFYNLGVFFRDRGEIEKALEYYGKAIELKPDFFDARWNKSLILLLLGRFKQGWEDYESRFKKASPVDSRVFNKPKWDGCLLNGKKILIASEQGFGDNINFIRYIPLVKKKGGYIILEAKKELKKLFQDFPGIDELVEKRENISDADFDCYIHLMSLPRIFNTTLETIPSRMPYLKARRSDIDKFKSKFNSNKFKIGIVWAGNPEQVDDKKRSTRFENFKILKQVPGIEIFSLQKGESSNQLDDDEILDLGKEMNDFADTAAVIENLDLIISVDTSVAHLAGAMGKPVWLLLGFIPDWRWFLGKKTSPWYSSMRLFRQEKPGEWDFVFKSVKKELEKISKI
jgi:hypothetical protein